MTDEPFGKGPSDHPADAELVDSAALTAYVASALWIYRNHGLASADSFRNEVRREYGYGAGDWNAACDQLQQYAHRQGDSTNFNPVRAL